VLVIFRVPVSVGSFLQGSFTVVYVSLSARDDFLQLFTQLWQYGQASTLKRLPAWVISTEHEA